MNHPDYSLFYQQLTGRVRESGAACFLLRTAGKTATGIMYLAYPILLILLGIRGDYRILLWTIFVPGAAFAVLTAVRAKINRPRPYETWDIDPLIHKDTKGNSMPSRHIFSSAVIFLSPYIGDGVKVGGKTVLSADNIMWFLEDLAGPLALHKPVFPAAGLGAATAVRVAAGHIV